MASQNFFEPVSSWISRMCEAVHLTGGPEFTSQTNFNNSEVKGNSSKASEYNGGNEHNVDELSEDEELTTEKQLFVHTSDAESWTSTDDEEETPKSKVSVPPAESRNNTPNRPEKRRPAGRYEDGSLVETLSSIPEDNEEYVNSQITALMGGS